MTDEWNDPKWEEVGRVHDWRNYVAPALQSYWPNLPEPLRKAIYEHADAQAYCEHWD